MPDGGSIIRAGPLSHRKVPDLTDLNF